MTDERFGVITNWCVYEKTNGGVEKWLTFDETAKKLNQLTNKNRELKLELEAHKHPLWSTREAEQKVNNLTELLMQETKKNALLLDEINTLRIENKRLRTGLRE